MNTAAAANEYKSNIGPDFSLADAYDAEYLDDAPAAEAEREAERRAEENAPVACARRPTGQRVGAFLI